MKKPYILVVEDDLSVADMLCDQLAERGYSVTYCTDALQALVQLEGLKVNLLIMDIMMPAFGSGLDAYKNIRSHPRLPKDLPIIFLTALKPEQVRHLVPLNDPRVRLFHKPTPFPKLLEAVRELTANTPEAKR